MLEPAHVCILFADLQEGTVQHNQTNQPHTLRRAAKTMAQLTKTLDLPVIFSLVPSLDSQGRLSPVITELQDECPDAPQFLRSTASALADQATRSAIQTTGRNVIGICGVATEVVVLHSAIDAKAAGYQVRVVLDACGGLSARTEDAAIRQMEAAGVVTTSVASFATEMVSQLSAPGGGPGPVIIAINELSGIHTAL